MTIRIPRSDQFGGYFAVLVFVILTAGAILAHGSIVLNYAFPALSMCLAFFLFVAYRHVYVAFVWWIWLFAPFVRRLVDYHTSYHKVSPIILSPVLVTLVAIIPLLGNPRFLLKRSMLPFSLISLVYTEALFVGILTNGVPALFDFANSIAPLAFGMFLMQDNKHFTENKDSLVFAIMLGLPLISLYGMYQFYNFPPWDLYWLKESNFGSAGNGLAEQTRLFGTLNAPGPYSQVLMASLVFTLVVKGPLKMIGGGVGFPAFGLSLVRASWGGWLFSALYVFSRIRGKARSRLVFFGMVAAIIAIPLVAVGPVANILSKRFASFSNLQQDNSFRERQSLYQNYTLTAISEPVGIGFGGVGQSVKINNNAAGGVAIDSGVLLIPYEFGWVWGGVFTWALFSIALRVLSFTIRSSDGISISGAGIYFSMLLLTLGTYVFSGVVGLIMWIAVALALGPVKALNLKEGYAGTAGSIIARSAVIPAE